MSVGDASFRELAVGSLWTGVVDVSDDCSFALWINEPVRVQADLTTGVHTIYGFVFAGFQGGLAVLEASDTSKWFKAKHCHSRSFRNIVDACCGLGGFSWGLWGLHGNTILSVDRSQLAVDTVRDNGGMALTGDIADHNIQLCIHQAADDSGLAVTLTAGLSSQPFQSSGSCNSAGTLPHILQLGWRLRVACIVLEQVPNIAGFREQSAYIEEFARRAGFQVVGVPLELSSSWAAHRPRWWHCLVPATLPTLTLSPMPAQLPELTVHDVMPELPSWPMPEEVELSWSPAEASVLLHKRYGGDPRILAWNAQAPILTHSCGNELQACPCGCRASGLTESQLLAGGSKGIGVHSAVTGGLRYLHPSEAGLLHTLSPAFKFLRGARAGLCLVGNISAPLHAHWIFLQLQAWAAEIFNDEPPVDKARSVAAFLDHLVQQRLDRWIVDSLQGPSPVTVAFSQDWHLPSGASPWTAGQVVEAAKAAVGPGWSVRIAAGDRELLPHALLHPGSVALPYTIQVRPKKQAKTLLIQQVPPQVGSPAEASCQVAVLTSAGAVFERCPKGTKLGTLLSKLRLSEETALLLGSGEHLLSDSALTSDCLLDARPIIASFGLPDLMSDVEVDRAVQRVREHAVPNAHCLSPGLADFLLAADVAPTGFLGSALGPCQRPLRLVLPFLADGHWACLCLQVCPEGSADAVYFDGVPNRVLSQATCLSQALATAAALSLRSFSQSNWFLQGPGQSCGEITVWHMCASVTGFGPHVPQLASYALAVRPCNGHATGAGDLSADQYASLRKLLLSKGVPAENVGQRIQDAVKKLGAGPIAAALAHKLAWQQLKSIASKPDCWFRWLSVEELAGHIEFKANEKFGASVPAGKHKKRKEPSTRLSTPVQVDPSKLLLAPGSFVNADGNALPQLAFDEVCSGACGIAFCSYGQVAPFASSGQRLSVDCLGLACVTELTPEQCGSLSASAAHFPAVYSPTGEAVLIRGSLLQLGDEPVQLLQSRISDTEQLDTVTCRFTVFRDEFASDWKEFVKAPVRVLVQGTPGLSLCKDSACAQGCGRFHAAVEEADCIDRLLLDVWGRQWSKLDGSRALPEEAQVFACLVRVPASALKHLHLLNVRGFYAEPRAASGTGPHPGFAVVWLPEGDHNKALHVLRTCQQAVAITRLGRRYGIRCRDSDEHTVFQALRPGCDFTKVKVTAHYRLHPLPVGCQRKHLVALLKSWQWTAKPLQPARGDGEGAAWIVGTAEEPPAPAIPCAGGFVLVRKVKDAAPVAAPAGLTASGRTLRKIIYDDEDTGVPDPWANGRDPWMAARLPLGLPNPPAPAASGTQSKLCQLKDELSKGMQDLVRQHISASSDKANSHAEANEVRLAKLETGFHELQQQGAKFEGWFQNLGQQVNQSASQLEQVQQTVAAQQHDLKQVRVEVTKQAESIPATVQAAVSALSADLGTQLQQQFQKQSSQLEALLAKKQRSE